MREPLWTWQHGTAQAVPFSYLEIAFSEIEGWAEDALHAALSALGKGAVTLPREAMSDEAAARAWVEARFTPFRVQDDTPGLLTGYYEPELRGSRTRSTLFHVPVYRRPPELEPVSGEAPGLLAAGLTAGVRTGPDWRPYFTRGEIDEGALSGRGLEILYLEDEIEAFVMHVQGSGLVRLEDGGAVRLAFDGKNGHPYTSVGKLLIERGLLKPDSVSLDRVMAVLREDMAGARAFLRQNKSYIFFREKEAEADAPSGSMGVRLTAGRSLAVDPRYHPLGSLIWVSAPALTFEGKPLRRLLAAQDTGSAITGLQRGDLFCGGGAEAGHIAGRIAHRCAFVLLRPKP